MSGLFDASLPQSLYPTLPNVFSMTLRNKITTGGNSSSGPAADGFTAAKTVSVRRRPATDEEVQRNALVGQKTITLSVLNDGSDPNFLKPEIDGYITDEDGVSWTIKDVKSAVMETLFPCVCVRRW